MIRVDCHTLFVDFGYRAREITTPVKIGASILPDEDFVPYPHEFIAVWDTGAMGTSITKDLARRLGLKKISETEVQGVTGTARCNTYLVSLGLPNGILIPEIEVADCEGNIGCDVLIGMDIITMGDFALCNCGGRTTFSFRVPSVGYIDFTNLNDPVYRNNPAYKHVHKAGRNAPCPCGSGKKYKRCCGG